MTDHAAKSSTNFVAYLLPTPAPRDAIRVDMNQREGRTGLINIYGPPASGKTRHGEQFRQHYRSRRVFEFDDLRKHHRLTMDCGDIVLSIEPIYSTNLPITHVPIVAALLELAGAKP